MDNPLVPGFRDAVLGAQSCFRAVLKAMAEPGTFVPIESVDPPAGLATPTWALALTLFDLDTPLWLAPDGDEAIKRNLAFHCGSPLVDRPMDASFALVLDPGNLPSLQEFNPGTLDYPDASTTVIIQGLRFGAGPGQALQGPGIETERQINIDGLSAEFWRDREVSNQEFPLGIDVILVADDEVMGLPRTTRIVT